MACDTCGARLTNHEFWEGGKLSKLWWEHTGLVPEGYATTDGLPDHDPVPVVLEANASPRAGFCDFCNTPDPVWSFPASPFKMDISSTLGWGSVDNWAACQDCKEDVEAGRWETIEKRYFTHKAVPRQFRSILRNEVRGLHRQFRLHRLGPPFRVRETRSNT